MGRWEPDARMRLVRAAVELCSEQGYDAVTVARIAERAGLSKATFFRHFPDKREVLFAGQEEHCALLAAGIRAAPPSASQLQALASGLSRLAASLTAEQRAFGRRLRAAVAGSAELQERDALKNVGLASAIACALLERGAPPPAAQLVGELGVLAVKTGYTAWSESGDATTAEDHMLAALEDLRATAASLN